MRRSRLGNVIGLVSCLLGAGAAVIPSAVHAQAAGQADMSFTPEGGDQAAAPPQDGPPSEAMANALRLYQQERYQESAVQFQRVVEGETGDAPPVDLDAERAHGAFILAHAARITACSDLSDGGLALAAFEMAAHGRTGVTFAATDLASLFAEDQARYLIALPAADAPAMIAAANAARIPIAQAVIFGGPDLVIGPASQPMADLKTQWQTAFAAALHL